MEQEGVIRGYRPVVDYSKIGKGVTAFVYVILATSQSCDDTFAADIGAVPGVVEGHFTDGDYARARVFFSETERE